MPKHRIELDNMDEQFDTSHIFAQSIGKGDNKTLKIVTTIFKHGGTVTMFQVTDNNTSEGVGTGNFNEAVEIYNNL